MLKSTADTLRHLRPPPVREENPASRSRTGVVRGVLTVFAWTDVATLGYYLLCALGFGLYLLLRWAF